VRSQKKGRYIPVHAPDTGDDVHGQDNRTKDSQFAQYIRSLFLALVHADVDLSEVIAMSARKQAAPC
jgi:hypothetical protein